MVKTQIIIKHENKTTFQTNHISPSALHVNSISKIACAALLREQRLKEGCLLQRKRIESYQISELVMVL